MLQVVSPEGPNRGAKRKYKHIRSRKVCEHCHSRKVRCDVMEMGVPCSNCKDYEKSCVIRRRKNQRQDATPSEDDEVGVANGSTTRDDTRSNMTPVQQTGIQSSANLSSTDLGDMLHGTFPGTAWTDQTVLPDYFDLGMDPSPAFTDFTHLTDLDDIFTFTANSLQPGRMQNEFSVPDWSSSWRFQATDLPLEQSVYLQSQGCFDIPPEPVLHEMMLSYFRWIHPHLPILVEDRFWARWSGETFQMEDYPLLLLRAMLFACMSQVDTQVISKLGFASKREARQAFYQRAKLLFEFGTETDPLTLSQACLLMTYQSPRYTRLRVNTSWLKQAIHYARIARADSHRRFQNSDPDRAMVLKRVWWAVLFRDCILSLGTRRSPQINHEPESLWHREPESLVQEDFTSELGNSPVHSTEAQLRIIQLVDAMCRLVPSLASTAKILYTVEGIDERLEIIDENKAPVLTQAIQRSLESLQTWHDETIPEFPFPVSLDMENTPEAVCLYANMLFIYHAAATFALNANLILLHEFFPASRSLINTEDCAKALQNGIMDVSQRSQELLQVRVTKYLPISATPLIAPPLILQAINVSAARSQNSPMEAVEARKLDIFTLTLKSQQERFEGADYCVDVLNNIIAYAGQDEDFVASMSSWQQKRSEEGSRQHGKGAVRLDWVNLVHRRPKLFLRLMMHLDHALCTGGAPVEGDFPAALRRH